jgi:hypothetical protein
MIDKFIRDGYLEWSSGIDLNELTISKSHYGMFALTPPPPATQAPANRTKPQRKRSSIATNFHVTKI